MEAENHPTRTTKIVLHRDGTVTYWSVYEQLWLTETVSQINDRELAAMGKENREKVIKHTSK